MREQSTAIRFLLLYFFFWLFISWLDRGLFILFAKPNSFSISFLDIIAIYWNGLIMDISMAAYICVLPFLGYILWIILPKIKLSRLSIDIYTYVLLAVTSILSIISINLYPEWTDKISKRAVDAFFESPFEAVSSASSTSYSIPIIVFLVIFIGGILCFHKLFKGAFFRLRLHVVKGMGFVLLGAFALFSCIRGGYDTSPLNESMAYFSTRQFYNHAAVNTYWSFINDYVHSGAAYNTQHVYFSDEKELDILLDTVFNVDKDSAYRIIDADRPNVVLILLESFTADLIGFMGGEPGVTPQLDRLTGESLAFTNFYAAAERSDKGIVGVFSGFPAQGSESIIKSVNKHEELSGIGQELKSNGYRTSFYYGGQSEFYNFKSYMLSHGIDRIVDKASFDIRDHESSWGVYDEKVFNRMLKDLSKEETPFFTSVFTISNHEPFDLKGPYKFGKGDVASMFKSTAYYTDSVLHDFLTKAQREPWYKNTLFIISADHGHRLPKERDITDPLRFRIPLIFFGEVLKPEFRGIKDNRIAGQVDLATSLLYQLNISSERYNWGRDIFNTSMPEYAFFNTKHSFGIVIPQGHVVIDASTGKPIDDQKIPNEDYFLKQAKAYMQRVLDAYYAF